MDDTIKDTLIQRLLDQQSKMADQVKSMQKELKDLIDFKNDVPTALDLLTDEAKKKMSPLSIEASESFKKQKFLPIRNKRGRGSVPLLESEIKEAQLKAVSARHASRLLNVCYPTYIKYAKMYGIDTLRNQPSRGVIKRKSPHKGKYPINDILDGKFPDYPIFRLKDKLISAKLKPPYCEQCGYSERRMVDGKIPLLLVFEDGNDRNHKLENLKLLCYNCSFTSGKIWVKTKRRKRWIIDPDRMQGAKDEVIQSCQLD